MILAIATTVVAAELLLYSTQLSMYPVFTQLQASRWL